MGGAHEDARRILLTLFKKSGTNDHGIGHLVRYTVVRFGVGFLAASVVAILLGVVIGLSRSLYRGLNPFIQVLKPISPLAWMPFATLPCAIPPGRRFWSCSWPRFGPRSLTPPSA